MEGAANNVIMQIEFFSIPTTISRLIEDYQGWLRPVLLDENF